MSRRLCILLVVIAVAGCSTAPEAPAVREPLLPEPLSPDSLGHALSLSQIVEGQYGNEIQRMRVELEVTPERLVTVGLSPLGVPLFTLEQIGNDVSVTGLGGDAPEMDPHFVLSDMQLTYWPEDVVDEALGARDFRLEVSAGERSRRVVAPDGRLLAEILYPAEGATPDEILIRHFHPAYSLRVTTLSRVE